jgi:hypothetical protein
MKAEYTAEDFKGAIKNPYYHKLNTEIVVAIRHDVFQVFLEVAEQNGVKPETIMNRCLTDYAKILKEHDE